MKNTKNAVNALYEQHNMPDIHLPFIFHTDTMRNCYSYSNWHGNPEFLYCIEGKGYVTCNSQRIDFEQGDTIIINPRVLHSVSSQSFVTYRCLIIDTGFFEENAIPADGFTFLDHIHDAEAGRLIEKVTDSYYKPQGELKAAYIRSAVLEYLLYICTHYSQTPDKSVQSATTKRLAAIRNVVDYIDGNFQSKLTLDELAEKVGFSKYHFTRIFREGTGYTLVEHINARRCEQAKHYLCETSRTISEICALCGFENASYFSKIFHSYTGMLPSEYRKTVGPGSTEHL